MAEPSPIPLEQRRPLSPHLQIYKWTPTMAASIVHRVTGAALYAGTVLLAFYLLAAAGDVHSYNFASAIFGSFLGQVVLFGYTFALLLHVMGGVRHAIWDTGACMEPEQRDRVSYASFIAAAALTVLLWIVSFILR